MFQAAAADCFFSGCANQVCNFALWVQLHVNLLQYMLSEYLLAVLLFNITDFF